MNFLVGDPYGFQRFLRAIHSNGLSLVIYMVAFWKLAKFGTSDAKELLLRISKQQNYLSWQQGRLWNQRALKPGPVSGVISKQLQSRKLPYQLTQYFDKVNFALRSRKRNLKFIKYYTMMMKLVFDSIMYLLRRPYYFYDVFIALCMLPRIESILKFLKNCLKAFIQLFKPSERFIVRERVARVRMADRLPMNNHLLILH